MILTSLSLEYYRNYPSLSLDLSGGNVHLFIGPNGSGKTNILEAVSVLSLLSSCRGREEVDLVTWGQGYYRVRGEVKSGPEKGGNTVGESDHAVRLEVVSELTPRKRKACFRNDVKIPPASMVGLLPTVTFLPQDLLLFSGPPAERRRFLDELLCQVSPTYLVDLASYQKILRQRNALLKRIADGSEQQESLSLWDREIARVGSGVTLARLELLETLNLTLGEELAGLGEHWNDVHIIYQRKGEARDREGIEKEFLAALVASRARDIILQSTGCGPHREDWHLLVQDRALPTFASRGQERTAVLALLFLQVSYLELQRGDAPIVLLDDAFSELDDAHRSALLSTLGHCQVLLTATHVPSHTAAMTLWTVEKGHVERTSVVH